MACPPSVLFVVERAVHLASTVLPGGGLFTSQAFTPLPPGAKEISYWITYTRGAAGGYPAAQVQWTNGTEQSSQLILDQSSISPGTPIADVNVYVEEVLLPAPNSDAALSYVLTAIVPQGATGFRLLAAERGAPGTPGTILIAYTGGVGVP